MSRVPFFLTVCLFLRSSLPPPGPFPYMRMSNADRGSLLCYNSCAPRTEPSHCKFTILAMNPPNVEIPPSVTPNSPSCSVLSTFLLDFLSFLDKFHESFPPLFPPNNGTFFSPPTPPPLVPFLLPSNKAPFRARKIPSLFPPNGLFLPTRTLATSFNLATGPIQPDHYCPPPPTLHDCLP